MTRAKRCVHCGHMKYEHSHRGDCVVYVDAFVTQCPCTRYVERAPSVRAGAS